MNRVNLTYFKDIGKYYSEGAYISKCVTLQDIWDEVREKRKTNTLPGINSERRFITLVQVPDHPYAHPRLIV